MRTLHNVVKVGTTLALLACGALATAQLPVPNNQITVPDSGKVTVKWDAVAGAAGYNVYRTPQYYGPGDFTTPLNAAPLTVRTYTDTGLTNGTRYYYIVTTIDSNGVETPMNQFPYPQASGVAGYVENGNFETRSPYDPNSPDRWFGGGAYGVSTTPHTGSLAGFVDGSYSSIYKPVDNLQPNTTYLLTVYAFLERGTKSNLYVEVAGSKTFSLITNTGSTTADYKAYTIKFSTGPSDTSVTVGIEGTGADERTDLDDAVIVPVVAPPTPTGLAFNATYPTVKLQWNASAGAASYSILRGKDTSGSETTLASNVTGTTYTDNTAFVGVNYFYRVVANSASGTSAASNEINVLVGNVENGGFETGDLSKWFGGGAGNGVVSATTTPSGTPQNGVFTALIGDGFGNGYGYNSIFKNVHYLLPHTTYQLIAYGKLVQAQTDGNVHYNIYATKFSNGSNPADGSDQVTAAIDSTDYQQYIVTFTTGDPNDANYFPPNTCTAEIGFYNTGNGNDGGAFADSFAVIPVTGATVTGRIALEGVSNLAGINANVSLGTFHIEFRTPGTTTVIKSADVALSPVGTTAFGTFSVSGVAPGTYDIAFKGAKNLRVVQPNVTVTGSAFALTDVLLPSGDATHDNTVDIGDFGVLVNAYGGDVTLSGSGYDTNADFNYDGVVDIGDFGILVNEYGNSGAM